MTACAESFAVGDRHEVDVGQVHRAIEHHQRHAGLQELAVDALVVLRGDHQQARRAFRAERIEVDALALERAVGVGQQHRVPVLLHLVVDAAHDGGEEQVLDVGNEDADRRALARAQGARGAIGLVVERLCGAPDAGFEIGAHPAGPRQHSRDRGRGHARHGGHLPNRGSAGHLAWAPGRRGAEVAELVRHGAQIVIGYLYRGQFPVTRFPLSVSGFHSFPGPECHVFVKRRFWRSATAAAETRGFDSRPACGYKLTACHAVSGRSRWRS